MTSSCRTAGPSGRRYTRNGQSRWRIGGGQHAFEVLEGRPAQVSVVAVQAAKRDLERFPWQHERQQREDVRQALACPVADELVEGRLADEPVEQPLALPDRAADSHLPENHLVHALAVDDDARILVEDGRQRPRRLEPDVESRDRRAPSSEAVGRALGDADRKDARQPAADGVVLVRIEQRIGQLADLLLGDLAEREQRVIGERIDREQRDHVRNESRRQPVFPGEHLDGAARGCAIAATGCPALRTGRDGSDRSSPWHPVAGSVERPALRRCMPRSTFAVESSSVSDRLDAGGLVDETAFERADIPAIQVAGGDDRADRAGDRQRQNRRGLGGGHEHDRESNASPPPTASPSRSNATSMTDLAARFSAAGIGV